MSDSDRKRDEQLSEWGKIHLKIYPEKRDCTPLPEMLSETAPDEADGLFHVCTVGLSACNGPLNTPVPQFVVNAFTWTAHLPSLLQNQETIILSQFFFLGLF